MRKKTPAGPCRSLSAEQRDEIEKRLRKQGHLQASADDLVKLRRRKLLLQGAEHHDTKDDRDRGRRPREHRPPMTVEVGHDIVLRLRPLAAKRDMPLARFVCDLLDAVGEEPSLAAAKLNDGEMPGP